MLMAGGGVRGGFLMIFFLEMVIFQHNLINAIILMQ